jgi:hypothetical protein
METGLEVNEREKRGFRDPERERETREKGGKRPNSDPLEQNLPDMGVVGKRECQDRIMQEPRRIERDQMLERRAGNLPENVHEAPRYLPVRRPRFPREDLEDWMWEEGGGDLPRQEVNPMEWEGIPRQTMKEIPAPTGRYQIEDLKGKGLEDEKFNQNRGELIPLPFYPPEVGYEKVDHNRGELMPPPFPPRGVTKAGGN